MTVSRDILPNSFLIAPADIPSGEDGKDSYREFLR